MREYLSLCGLLRLVFNLYSSSSATSEALRVCCGSGSISISVSGVCGDSVVVGAVRRCGRCFQGYCILQPICSLNIFVLFEDVLCILERLSFSFILFNRSVRANDHTHTQINSNEVILLLKLIIIICYYYLLFFMKQCCVLISQSKHNVRDV